MTRPIARALAVFLPVSVPVLASLTGCTPTPTILPTNDFNRPTDIAFMCLGAFEHARRHPGRSTSPAGR